MDLRAELEKRITKAASLRALAREWGVSAAYLSEVRRGGRPVSDKLMAKLGIERRVTYRKTANGAT